MTQVAITDLTQNILNAILIFGAIFAVYKYFRGPQEKTEKNDAVMAEQFKQLRLEFTNLRDNHIHTLDVKIDGAITSINHQSVELAKLTTIIDERIPKKNNL